MTDPTARYSVGDRVHVRNDDPPGHIRTPWYIRGKEGRIERICGTFGNPETLAYGGDGKPRQPLYRVRFRQAELWPDYRGAEDDTLDIEIYQHWLEPGDDGGSGPDRGG